MRAQLPKGRASTLEFYPAEGPPTSVSVELYVQGTTALVASPSASVDSVGENPTAAAAEGATSIAIDTTAIVVGRDYWVTTAGGRAALVRCIDKTSSSMELEQPLPFELPTSGSVEGARISVALTADDTATRYRRCEARWTYTAASVVRYQTQRFDIVERPFNLTVPEPTIERVWPAFGEYAGKRGAWRQHVAYAIDQIGLWLQSRQIEPDLVREPYELERAAAHIVVARMHMREPDLYEMHMQASEKILTLVESSPLWVDDDQDLAVDEGAEATDGQSELGPRVRYMGIG